MPEVLKKSNGEVDYTKLFMGLAMAIVLVLQQWQSYKIAEIQTVGEVNKINFMSKDKIEQRLEDLEKVFMNKEKLIKYLDKVEARLNRLEEERWVVLY